jgi:hypothetical protein
MFAGIQDHNTFTATQHPSFHNAYWYHHVPSSISKWKMSQLPGPRPCDFDIAQHAFCKVVTQLQAKKEKEKELEAKRLEAIPEYLSGVYSIT